jgi:hypothetical protein
LRWLVRVTFWAALVVPTDRAANVRVAGVTVTGADPVPARLTVCGVFAALSLNVRVPARAPVAVGENVTPTVQVAPAATLGPHVLLAIAKSPEGVILANVRAVFLWLVSVTDLLAPVLPTATLPQANVAADRVTGVVPVPVRAAVRGLRLALSVTVRVPVSAPTIVGLNVRRIVQLAPPARVLGLREHVPPALAKSPLTDIAEIVSGTVWTFFSVSVFEALIVPRAWFPNPNVAGVSVTGATPVPKRATDCGLVDALWVTVSVEVRLPSAAGLNVTLILQLAPAPSVLGLSGQFPPQT